MSSVLKGVFLVLWLHSTFSLKKKTTTDDRMKFSSIKSPKTQHCQHVKKKEVDMFFLSVHFYFY